MNLPTTLDYASPRAAKSSRRGRGSLAVAGSMLLPGLGHLFAGNWPRGLRWLILMLLLSVASIVCMSVPAAVPALVLLLPAEAALEVILWVDAYRYGRASSRQMLPHPALRYLATLLIVGVVVLLAPIQYLLLPLKWHVVEAFIIPTASMSPTIISNDQLLVHKLRPFRRFDVVAIHPATPRSSADLYIERVVGFPNETIEIASGGLRVNGRLLHPPSGVGPYVSRIGTLPIEPLKRYDGKSGNGIEGNPIHLGPDEYFFLGDNSAISGDSRVWAHSVDGHQPGTLPRDHIKGVATWIYWPPSRWKRLG